MSIFKSACSILLLTCRQKNDRKQFQILPRKYTCSQLLKHIPQTLELPAHSSHTRQIPAQIMRVKLSEILFPFSLFFVCCFVFSSLGWRVFTTMLFFFPQGDLQFLSKDSNITEIGEVIIIMQSSCIPLP